MLFRSYRENQADIPSRITAESSGNQRLLIPKGDATTRSGNLYVDGGYSEAHRSLLFKQGSWREPEPVAHDAVYFQPQLTDDGGNFGSEWGQKGALIFWFKPNWHPERAGRPHVQARGHDQVHARERGRVLAYC